MVAVLIVVVLVAAAVAWLYHRALQERRARLTALADRLAGALQEAGAQVEAARAALAALAGARGETAAARDALAQRLDQATASLRAVERQAAEVRGAAAAGRGGAVEDGVYAALRQVQEVRELAGQVAEEAQALARRAQEVEGLVADLEGRLAALRARHDALAAGVPGGGPALAGTPAGEALAQVAALASGARRSLAAGDPLGAAEAAAQAADLAAQAEAALAGLEVARDLVARAAPLAAEVRQEAAAAWAEVGRFRRDFRSPSRPWLGDLPRDLDQAAEGLERAAQEVAAAWARGDLALAGQLAREALDQLEAVRDRRRELARVLAEGQRLREGGEAEATRLEATLDELAAAVEGVPLPAAGEVAAAVARGREALAAFRSALQDHPLDVDRAGAALAAARQAQEEAHRKKETLVAGLQAELERLRAEYGDNPAWSPLWAAFQAGEGALNLILLYQLVQQARALAAGEPVPAGPAGLGPWPAEAPGGAEGAPADGGAEGQQGEWDSGEGGDWQDGSGGDWEDPGGGGFEDGGDWDGDDGVV